MLNVPRHTDGQGSPSPHHGLRTVGSLAGYLVCALAIPGSLVRGYSLWNMSYRGGDPSSRLRLVCAERRLETRAGAGLFV